ncbi:MAG: glycoside hydrolase domain-containing protein [Planctomycetota bacterium]
MAKANVAAAVLAGMTVAVLALGGIPGFGGEPAPEAPHPGGEVLGAGSYLRVFLVGAPDQVKRDSGDVEAVAAGHADKARKQKMRHSAFPSPDWRSPDFNDLFWPRRLSPVETSRERTSSLLCARGRFLVGDPGKADLTLSLSFRGGAVVYVNGKEIARAHMPQGAVQPDTPAESYPKEAWVDPDGFVLFNNDFGGPKGYPDRFKLRERRIEDLKIPAEALRKGVNVLAVEIHRPYTDVAFYDGKPRQYSKSYCQWSTLALDGLKMTAPAGASVAGAGSNVKGFRVWNRDVCSWVADSDWPDVGEALRPINILGARNGGFSAQVVAGSDGAIRGLKVVPSDLKGEKGAIPAARLQVRYALPDGPEVKKGGPRAFDGLEESAPAEVPAGKEGRAVQPIWVTVNVPADTPAGGYAGRLVIEAQGAGPVEVPVNLSVADWTLPPVTESHSYYWLVQSPETLARQYGVEMWSDRHWELIGKSFDLMRQVGTRIVYIPMFRQSHLGNEHTMVRWIRDGKAPGGYRHDFSIFEKYLDVALKRLGKLDVVCLHCWPISTGGQYFDPTKVAATEAKPIRITVVDPASGKIEEAEGPAWGQPESREFWKAALSGARERLAARGLAEAMMVGISHDHVPGKACVEDLQYAAPEAKWVVHCHPYMMGNIHGVPVGYLGNVWGMPSAPFPEDGRNQGWKDRGFWTTFPRYGSGVIGTLGNDSPLAEYRGSLTGAICAGYKDRATKTMLKGYGWIGADFWALKNKRGGGRHLLDLYDYDRRTNLGIPASVTCMLRPGKDGPVSTARLEMVRQNLQEVEARVFLEKILGDPAGRATVGDDLAKRCQDLLDAQISAVVWGKNDWDLMLGYDWERLSGELYRLAAEVAGNPGGK